MLKTIVMYFMSAARGVLFLNKAGDYLDYNYGKTRSLVRKGNEQLELSEDYLFAYNCIEALADKVLVDSMIYTARMPVCS